MQDQGKGLQPIAFISRSLNAAEQNYSTTERELLGIVHATWEWRHLISGSHCKLQGDHKPLEALFSPGKELTRRQARWIEKLIQVGVPEMEHVPGKSIPVPDALSRKAGMPVYTPQEGMVQQQQNTFKSEVDPDFMVNIRPARTAEGEFCVFFVLIFGYAFLCPACRKIARKGREKAQNSKLCGFFIVNTE